MLGAIDFTTIEVWTKGGLVTFYLLFVMELKTRHVHFAGCTLNPDEIWMKQIAKNWTDCENGFLKGTRYFLMDRDGKFCPAFREIVKNEGTKPVRLPPKSPNLNAHLERYFHLLKEECLGRLILFVESSLRNAVKRFVAVVDTYRFASSEGAQEPGLPKGTDFQARKDPNQWVGITDRGHNAPGQTGHTNLRWVRSHVG